MILNLGGANGRSFGSTLAFIRVIRGPTFSLAPSPLRAIRGSHSKKISFFLKRSRFFSFVREWNSRKQTSHEPFNSA
jgi:hypothetical protein